MVREIVGIAPDFRNQLGELDRHRDLPIRAGRYDVAHVVCEHGRLVAIGLADDHSHRQEGRGLPAHRTQLELGKIDDDRRLRKVGRDPSIAFERELELFDPLAQRHIELGDRLLAEHAVGLKAVALLKVLHPIDHGALVYGGVGGLRGVGREVAKLAQTRDQRRDSE